uniref:Uncharacterized protein n=1 Tax=viral metagenome TaxID=1070528 RepID=A0A6C0F9Q1_9ZZZZ
MFLTILIKICLIHLSIFITKYFFKVYTKYNTINIKQC